MDAVLWVFQNIALAFYNFFYAILNPGLWLNWSEPEAVMRFIYYGGSAEFFFVIFTASPGMVIGRTPDQAVP